MAVDQDAAFQFWLQRKNDEQRRRVHQERQQRMKEKELELERLKRGKEAYCRWLKKVEYLDDVRRKEEIARRQQVRLWREEMEKRRILSLREYNSWKERKHKESLLQSRNNIELDQLIRTLSGVRAQTPSLPGYMSVWSCDNEIAEIMLAKVKKRPSSCIPLIDTVSFEQ